MDKIIRSLVRRHGSTDPFLLARELGICVIYEELGSIRGYYNQQKRQKFIHINNRLSESQARFTAAHELGHALLHSKENVPFLRENTLFSTNRLEVEANAFALRLLLHDQKEESRDCSSSQIAAMLGVDEKLLLRHYRNLFHV